MQFRVAPKVIFSNPVHFLAFGFGSGLSAKAPGTVGTLVSLPMVLMMMHSSLWGYLVCLVVLTIFGVYICGESARRLGIHDHPGIVWDEFVGMAITMTAVPFSWLNLLLGFVMFRFFDIVKPWPIREVDHSLSGGIGIMLDDILAGVFSCALLHGLIQIV